MFQHQQTTARQTLENIKTESGGALWVICHNYINTVLFTIAVILLARALQATQPSFLLSVSVCLCVWHFLHNFTGLL